LEQPQKEEENILQDHEYPRLPRPGQGWAQQEALAMTCCSGQPGTQAQVGSSRTCGQCCY